MNARNNKGFSLVELIVVIAIMAVLVGVVSVMFIRYIDRSRMSIDVQNVSNLCHVVETFAADVDTHKITIPENDSLSLTLEYRTASQAGSYWEKSLLNAEITEYGLRSSTWFDDPSQPIVITVKELHGMPYFEESNVAEGLSILEGDTIK